MEVKFADNSNKIISALTDEALPRALLRIGLQAEGYAKDLAPVRTGRLRNSITHVENEQEKSVIIGTNVEYGPAVELGTTRQRAQPYLKPAISQHGQTYKNILEDELKNT